MRKIFNPIKKSRPLINLILCGACLIFAFRATGIVHTRLAALPVVGVINLDAPQKEESKFENLPLIYAQPLKEKIKPKAAQPSPLDIDAAFLPPAKPKNDKSSSVVLMDYFNLLPKAITVGGVSKKGAFLSGPNGSEYVRFGEKISAFAYPSKKGQMIAPILLSRKGKYLLIKEPNGHKRIKRLRIPL